MRDLVPWLGIEPGPPALGAWSLNHWTTKEVPKSLNFLKVRSWSFQDTKAQMMFQRRQKSHYYPWNIYTATGGKDSPNWWSQTHSNQQLSFSEWEDKTSNIHSSRLLRNVLWKYQPNPVFLKPLGLSVYDAWQSKLDERAVMWQQAQRSQHIFTQLVTIGPCLYTKPIFLSGPQKPCIIMQRTDWKLNWQHCTTDGPPAGKDPDKVLLHWNSCVFFIHSWQEGCLGVPNGMRAIIVAHTVTG